MEFSCGFLVFLLLIEHGQRRNSVGGEAGQENFILKVLVLMVVLLVVMVVLSVAMVVLLMVMIVKMVFLMAMGVLLVFRMALFKTQRLLIG